MADFVYVLCAVASLACAALLFRAWRGSGTPLLFWSTVCFAGFALNNLLLVVDLVLYPAGDLRALRSIIALVALSALIYGLIWDVEDAR
jgi:hypothetical protein